MERFGQRVTEELEKCGREKQQRYNQCRSTQPQGCGNTERLIARDETNHYGEELGGGITEMCGKGVQESEERPGPDAHKHFGMHPGEPRKEEVIAGVLLVAVGIKENERNARHTEEHQPDSCLKMRSQVV